MSEPTTVMSKLWETLPQLLSILVSVFAVVTFIKQGTKSKVEQAEALALLTKTVADLTKSVQDLRADHRTESEEIREEIDAAHTESTHAIEKVWDTVKVLQAKQTTLCALHSVNHPGQAVGG